MPDVDNVKLGACSVEYNGTDLGHTMGSVVVTYEQNVHDTTVDKFGTTPVKKTLIGERLRATVPLAEYQLATLQSLIETGSADASKMTLGGKVGDNLPGYTLVLHPHANNPSDLSEDVVIWKAVLNSDVELRYEVDGERVIEVEFEGIIDEDRSDGDQLGLIGDSTT